jgi:hypothetical protein
LAPQQLRAEISSKFIGAAVSRSERPALPAVDLGIGRILSRPARSPRRHNRPQHQPPAGALSVKRRTLAVVTRTPVRRRLVVRKAPTGRAAVVGSAATYNLVGYAPRSVQQWPPAFFAGRIGSGSRLQFRGRVAPGPECAGRFPSRKGASAIAAINAHLYSPLMVMLCWGIARERISRAGDRPSSKIHIISR